MKNLLKHQLGFSLVELIIYMGLVVVLFVVLTSVFLTTLDVQLTSQTSSSVQQEGRYLLARLSFDIRRANSITTPAGIGILSPTLSLVIAGVPYTYSVNNGQLQLTINGTTTSVLNEFDTGVTAFSVQEIGNAGGKPTVQLELTISSTNSSSTQIIERRTYQTTVDLR